MGCSVDEMSPDGWGWWCW